MVVRTDVQFEFVDCNLNLCLDSDGEILVRHAVQVFARIVQEPDRLPLTPTDEVGGQVGIDLFSGGTIGANGH